MNAGRTGKLHGEKKERRAATTRSAGMLSDVTLIVPAFPWIVRSSAGANAFAIFPAVTGNDGVWSNVKYPFRSITNNRGISAMLYRVWRLSESRTRCQRMGMGFLCV